MDAPNPLSKNQMKCFPNGTKHKFAGWVGLSLILKKSSIPSNVTNVVVKYYLYESQTQSVARGVARFTNNEPVIPPEHLTDGISSMSTPHGPHRPHRKSSINDSYFELESPMSHSPDTSSLSGVGHAKSNGTNYLCSKESLKRFNMVSLVCEFKIVRQYHLGQQIYGKPLRMKKIMKFQWDITNKNLIKFRRCHDPYTRLYSEEFNIWNLVLVPSSTTSTSKGNISLRLRLHELPPVISEVKAIVVLSCAQFGRDWTAIHTFSYDRPWISWPSKFLKKSIVEERLKEDHPFKIEKLSFECCIEILSIDIHSLVITDSDSRYKDVWNKFVDDHLNIFMMEEDQEHNGEAIENNASGTTHIGTIGGKEVDPLSGQCIGAFNGDDLEEDDADIDTDDDLEDDSLFTRTPMDLKMADYGAYKEEGEEDSEYIEYQKEQLVRMSILQRLDLNQTDQKQYLMQKFHAMNEHIAILRRESKDNRMVIEAMQSDIQSLPENMFSSLNLQLHFENMGSGQSDASGGSGDGDEKNAHKVLVIRTKDSSGYLLIGANKQGGYYHSKKYITFDHHDQKNITIALSLWDTPAIDFSANVHDQVTSPYYKYAHGLFCVYNVESTESFNLMCNKISYLYKNPQKTPFKDATKVAIMLIGHKSKDFHEKNRKVSQEKAIKYANALDITFFEVDSSDWQDVSDLYTIMGKSIFQIYGELPLHNRTSMTEVDETCHIVAASHSNNPSGSLSPDSTPVIDDEKVNDTVRATTPLTKRGTSPAERQSDSDLSELSEVGVDENFQPTKTPKSMTPKRSNHRFGNRERSGATEDLPGCASRSSESLPNRHRSTHSSHGGSIATDDRDGTPESNPVSEKFREFIGNRVQMPYLFDLFASQHYDDIRMIEYFDDEMLRNEIGIKNLIHRKLFLQQCADFKFEIKQFKEWLTQRVQLRRYLPTFESAGLITMTDITAAILSQSDFALKLKIVNRNHQAILWQELQSYESATNDADYVHPSESRRSDDESAMNSSFNSKLKIHPEQSPSPNTKLKIAVQQHGGSAYGGSVTPSASFHSARARSQARTKMGGAYAHIQRNKEIFGAISGNEKFKQETESKKRKNSLESDMTNVQMNGFDEKMRSSSVTSTCSEPAIRGSVMLKRQQSTPTITTLTSPKDMKLKPRKKLKRRKSFGLGLK